MYEIERRFLIDVDAYSALSVDLKDPSYHISQGYVTADPVVRIRSDERNGCILALKSGRGLVRKEIEIPISRDIFSQIWPMTLGLRIEKLRQRVRYDGRIVEVDTFLGHHHGLHLAEVEFPTVADAEAFTPPSWFGREVTHDSRYINAVLARNGLPSAEP